MTTPNHAVMSFLIVYIATRSTIAALIGTFFGIFPDVGKFFFGDKHNEYGWFYQFSHNLIVFSVVIIIGLILAIINIYVGLCFLMFGLHGAIDYPIHDKINGGWNKYGIIFEICWWLINVFLIYKIMRLI